MVTVNSTQTGIISNLFIQSRVLPVFEGPHRSDVSRVHVMCFPFMANRDHSCAQNSSKAREVTEILTPPSAWILCRSFGQTGFSLLSKEKNSYRLFIDKTDNRLKKAESLCFVKNRFFFDVVAIHQFIDVVTDSHSVESDTSQLLLHFEFLFP